MVIRKLYVPPTVVKTNPLPPAVDPNHLPPAAAYQPPAEDVPIVVEPESSTSNGGNAPLVFADEVELDVLAGKIIGRRKALPNGLEYYYYQGIPYAQPPVGELRFMSPVPLGHGLAIFSLPEGPSGVEDCLYLFTTCAPAKTLVSRVIQMEENCIVEISSGRIRGTVAPLPEGAGFCYSFKGIPYAVPPVGSLRFRPPQPLTRHSEALLDCTQERAVSLTSSYIPPNAELASEDCLFLNVYTPINPNAELTDLQQLPVMVWLHGGAFFSGSGDSSIYHPEWLVAQGVIVVTLNYRVGPAGFLCLPSVSIFGNMGLKDQRLALQWVQQNIMKFGGNVKNVTLFGESAGGVSAHLHCLSERSQALFHKVICQSGVATTSITFQKNPEEKARRLAEYFGCPKSASDDQVLETLMTVDPKSLAKAQSEALTAHEKTLDNVYAFRPVVELPGSIDPIVTENAINLLRHSSGQTKPMILGIVSEETLHKVNNFRQHLQRYKDEKCRFIPYLLNVPAEERLTVADQILEFYCGTAEVSLEKEVEMSRIFGDAMYLFPAVQTAELHLNNSQSSIYFYHFGAETELNKFRQFWAAPPEYRGAIHADELCYLFSSSFFNTDAVVMDSPAWKLRKTMCCLWTSFAKSGVPRLNDDDITWTPLVKSTTDSFNLTALQIDETSMKMSNNFLADRVGFWRGLFKKYNNQA